MSDYRVKLLGIPGVAQNGGVVRFPYRKAEALFYYLCVEKNTSRDELVSIFWGSYDEDSGRKNLRQALFQMRRCLGEDIIVLQGRNDLKLNQRSGIQTDWSLPNLEFAFCRERFLDFFYLKDCPEFEDWVDKKREQQVSRSLEYVKSQLKTPPPYRNNSHLQHLIETWQYWKPWDEEVALTGMKCYIQAGKYELGLQLYHEYTKYLQRDLEETPSHAVDLLFRTLLHRKDVAFKRIPNCKSSFFGRVAEFQYIDEQIFYFLNDEASASVVIEGEVGVGKTALMQQIFEMNRDAGVLQFLSHCYSVEAEFPLKSWRDLFVQLEDLQSDRKVNLSEHSSRLIQTALSGRLMEELDATYGRSGETWSYTALENGVLRLFKELVSKWKIILYLDSIQWMDAVSQRLLQRVMIEFGNEQVFMVATCRVDEEKQIRGLLLALRERNIITSLRISCFTEAETEEIMNNALADCEHVGVDAKEMFRRTEGNPLVLMETLDMIRQDGWSSNSPLPRIDMLIRLRLDRLTSQQKRVLDALAIHLEHADLEDLQLLVGMEPLDLIEMLEQLLQIGFVIEQPWGNNVVYKFRHQFYKDYIYQNLSLGKRRLWHHTVAEFYDKQKVGDRWRILLPYTMKHYEYGGNTDRARALRELQTDR